MWLVITLVATWSIYNQYDHINRDGLLYLKQAYLFGEGSWEEGFAIYNWPLFGMLISLFHKITNFHLQFNAHVIDLALFSIATYFYLKTLQLIVQQKYIIFYAGLALLSFIPIMDDYVGMILRDHGFWAGCMAGTYFYLKYIDHDFPIKYSLLWQLSFLIAGAFRPEGLVFLIAIPLFNIFFIKNNYLKRHLFKIILNLASVLILISLYFYVVKNIMFEYDLLAYPVYRFEQFETRIDSFFKQLLSPLPIFTDHVYLNLLLQNNQFIILVSVLGSLFLMKFFQGLGILNLALMYLHFRNGSKISKKNLKILYFLIIISLCTVFIEFFHNFVLTKRYLVLSYFWILIILTPALHSLFELDSYFKNKILNFLINILIIIIIVISILNVLIDKNSYSIEIEAGEFLKQLQIDEEVTFINADRIGYYAGFPIKLFKNQLPEISDYKNWVVIYYDKKTDYIVPLDYTNFKHFKHKDHEVIFLKKRN